MYRARRLRDRQTASVGWISKRVTEVGLSRYRSTKLPRCASTSAAGCRGRKAEFGSDTEGRTRAKVSGERERATQFAQPSKLSTRTKTQVQTDMKQQ